MTPERMVTKVVIMIVIILLIAFMTMVMFNFVGKGNAESTKFGKSMYVTAEMVGKSAEKMSLIKLTISGNLTAEPQYQQVSLNNCQNGCQLYVWNKKLKIDVAKVVREDPRLFKVVKVWGIPYINVYLTIATTGSGINSVTQPVFWAEAYDPKTGKVIYDGLKDNNSVRGLKDGVWITMERFNAMTTKGEIGVTMIASGACGINAEKRDIQNGGYYYTCMYRIVLLLHDVNNINNH